MRIGTWNLQGRWEDGDYPGSRAKRIELLENQNCDVWLLTEVSPKAVSPEKMIAGFHCHHSEGRMNDKGSKQYWAAVLSRDAMESVAHPDPHTASAAAVVNGITFCSSILPWSGCATDFPGIQGNHEEMMQGAIAILMNYLPKFNLVWGGDWNQTFEGYVYSSAGGRKLLQETVESLTLQVLTTYLPSQRNGCRSIDHIAVPTNWEVWRVEWISAKRLSDHDAYVVEVQPQ